MVKAMLIRKKLINWLSIQPRCVTFTLTMLLGIVTILVFNGVSALLLDVLGLAYRHWVVSMSDFLLLFLVIALLCGCIACLYFYGDSEASVLKTMGTLALLGSITYVFLLGGFLTLWKFATIEEQVSERDGIKMLAEVDAFVEVHVYYYEYKNWFIRGKFPKIQEWYGSGGYNPFKIDPMPEPKKVYYSDEGGRRIDEAIADEAMPQPESQPTPAAILDSSHDEETPVFASEEAFLSAIEDTILEGYEKLIANKWIVQNSSIFIAPAYPLTDFEFYVHPFVKGDHHDPDHRAFLLLWYNPRTFELLVVTQYDIDGQDTEGIFTFSKSFSDGKTVEERYPWVSYVATYQVDRNGQRKGLRGTCW